jgi:hypothetical protein
MAQFKKSLILFLFIPLTNFGQSLEPNEILQIFSKYKFSSITTEKAMDFNLSLKEVDSAIEMKKKGVAEKIILNILKEKIIASPSKITEILNYQKKGYSNEVIIKSLDNSKRYNPIPAKITEDPAFTIFLTNLKTILENHSWNEFTKKCWWKHFSMQAGENPGKEAIERYIAETIGSMVDNEIQINEIKEVTYEYSTVEFEVNEEINLIRKIPTYTIIGKIRFKNREIRKLNIMIMETSVGVFEITGAWG